MSFDLVFPPMIAFAQAPLGRRHRARAGSRTHVDDALTIARANQLLAFVRSIAGAMP